MVKAPVRAKDISPGPSTTGNIRALRSVLDNDIIDAAARQAKTSVKPSQGSEQIKLLQFRKRSRHKQPTFPEA